ncbi:MAG TPA: LptF/LptG family permease, partial [Paracoccaceae bacterium]|nr:LptF/LptG family permease [Paracoccaceae bacterium]
SGFSSSRHRLHWLRLAAQPAVFVAMVLIGAVFSMRHQRFGGLGYMALATVIAGFGYFFLSDIAGALGASGAIPVMLSGLGPPLAAVLLSLGLLLHLEDG